MSHEQLSKRRAYTLDLTPFQINTYVNPFENLEMSRDPEREA